MNNMKIEINDAQPLDEVVKELERLGYDSVGYIFNPNCDFVIQADEYGYFTVLYRSEYPCITLAELKEMK